MPTSEAYIETTPNWEQYLDLQQDVKPWLRVAHLTDIDPILADLTGMACQFIQRYLGRPVAPTTFTRLFDGYSGWKGAYIILPYAPVLQMISVKEYWGVSGPHTLTEQTPSSQGTQDAYQLDPLRGTLTRTFPGLVQRPWFPGSRNVEITWVAGFNPVPADIKVATLELINYWYRNTQEATRTSSYADRGYEEPQAGGGTLWPGIPNRVAALLESYKQVGLG